MHPLPDKVSILHYCVKGISYPFIGCSPASVLASLMWIKTAFSIGMQEKPKSAIDLAMLTFQGKPPRPPPGGGLVPKVILASGMYFLTTSAKSRAFFGGPPTL